MKNPLHLILLLLLLLSPSPLHPSPFLPCTLLPSPFLPSPFLPCTLLPSPFLPCTLLPSPFLPCTLLPSPFLPCSSTVPELAEGLPSPTSRDSIQISLLTCAEKADMYASFGHSAIRIQNFTKHEDKVYDYGIFNFNEPHFVWKFLRGNLMYWVASRDFHHFMASHQRDGRKVTEDILKLSYTQKQTIIHKLQENLKPENKYYKYDFINDNCATRIRDMLLTDDVNFNNEATGITFRNNFDYYLDSRKWMQLGVDLLLGQVADKEMTRSDEMYLPFALSTNLKEITFNGESILESTHTIFPGKKMLVKRSSTVFQPLIVLSAILLIFISLFIYKPRLLSKTRPYIYVLVTLMSTVVLFLWFASSHDATSGNWNILWINPLYILLAFGPTKPYKKILAIILLTAASATILLSWLIPQQLNFASFPFIGILILLLLNYLLTSKIPLKST